MKLESKKVEDDAYFFIYIFINVFSNGTRD